MKRFRSTVYSSPSLRRLVDVMANCVAIIKSLVVRVGQVVAAAQSAIQKMILALLGLLTGLLYLAGTLVFLGGCAAFLLPLGFQILSWLQTGHWGQLPGAELGVATIGTFLGLTELQNWAVAPESWVGLHELMNSLHAGIIWAWALFILVWIFVGLGSAMNELKEEWDSGATDSGDG